MLQSNESTIGVLLGSLQNRSAWFVFSVTCFHNLLILFINVSLTGLCILVYVIYQRNDFWNEAINLADLHHPNVVAFYGVVIDGPGGSVATVTEFMVNGSLRNALQKNEK